MCYSYLFLDGLCPASCLCNECVFLCKSNYKCFLTFHFAQIVFDIHTQKVKMAIVLQEIISVFLSANVKYDVEDLI